MLPPARPAVIPGIAILMGILALPMVLFGVLFFTLDFPFPLLCGIAALIGLGDAIAAAGLYTMQRWARPAAIVFLILTALFVIGAVPAAILIYYLYKPEVKAAYGQGPPVPPRMYGMAPPYVPDPWAYRPPPPQYVPGLPPTAPRPTSCANCGAPLDAAGVYFSG